MNYKSQKPKDLTQSNTLSVGDIVNAESNDPSMSPNGNFEEDSNIAIKIKPI